MVAMFVGDCFPETYSSAGSATQVLKGVRHMYWLEDEKETLLSVLMILVEQGVATIYNVCTPRRFRGAGLAKRLLILTIRHWRSRFPQLQELFLTVAPQNHAARRLYDKLGFRVVDTRPGNLLYMRLAPETLVLSE